MCTLIKDNTYSDETQMFPRNELIDMRYNLAVVIRDNDLALMRVLFKDKASLCKIIKDCDYSEQIKVYNVFDS